MFVVRQRITRDDGDECLFRFEPVFVNDRGEVDASAVAEAVAGESSGEAARQNLHSPEAVYEVAREFLESKSGIFDWEDDVEFVGLSWIAFV